MDEAKRRLVVSWLTKAAHDLESAQRLSSGPDPLLDAAIYHCQQAAVAFHLEGLAEEGVKAPKPASSAEYVEVA